MRKHTHIYIYVYLIQNLCFNLLFKNFVELNLLYVYIHKIMNKKRRKLYISEIVKKKNERDLIYAYIESFYC